MPIGRHFGWVQWLGLGLQPDANSYGRKNWPNVAPPCRLLLLWALARWVASADAHNELPFFFAVPRASTGICVGSRSHAEREHSFAFAAAGSCTRLRLRPQAAARPSVQGFGDVGGHGGWLPACKRGSESTPPRPKKTMPALPLSRHDHRRTTPRSFPTNTLGICINTASGIHLISTTSELPSTRQ